MKTTFTTLFGRRNVKPTKTMKRSPWKNARLGIETLEVRSLLSGTPLPPGISLNQNGTLSINGDDRGDVAVVSIVDQKVKVTLDQTTMVQIDINTYVPLTIHTEKEYDKSLVKKINFF